MKEHLVQVNLGELDNSCFIVMPFSQLFQTEYEKIIQPALIDLNITCVRGDEIYSKQRIMDDIWHSIRKCRFVLAELTGRNPNVLYEIGLAHAIGKPVIIITRNADDVPFDLKDLRYLYYDVNDPFWGDNLKKGIQNLVQKILENPKLESYLEGITLPEGITYPTNVKGKDIANRPKVKKIIDVSGTWVGQFNDTKHPTFKTIKVTLQISQNGEDLFASSVNSLKTGNTQAVVQQMMNGNVKGNQINLHGVNYTFVERGDLTSYILDSYKLVLEDNPSILKGVVTDEKGLKTDFILQKF